MSVPFIFDKESHLTIRRMKVRAILRIYLYVWRGLLGI